MLFGRNIANRLRLRFVEPSLCVIRFRHADIDICLQGHNAKKAELAGQLAGLLKLHRGISLL